MQRNKRKAQEGEEPTESKRAKTEATQREPEKEQAEEKSKILETGLIYFFYRPKVELEEVSSLEEVSRMFFVMSPKPPELLLKSRGSESKTEQPTQRAPLRLILMGKKKLPEIGKHARYWGTVEKVTTDVDELAHSLESKEYETETRGERKIGGMRPLGEGVYALVMHHGHSHLAYVLEIPEEVTEVQKAFNIGPEGSYILQVKNPEHPWAKQQRTKEKVKYPDELQKVFEGRKWSSADPPQLLDYPGVEILLVGAKSDIVKELGGTGKFLEKLEHEDEKKYHRLKDDKLFEELHLSKKEFPKEPLRGIWK